MFPALYTQPILFRAQPLLATGAAACVEQAGRLAAAGGPVLLAWGGLPWTGPLPAGVSLSLLPAAWARPDAQGTILDEAGVRADNAWKKRRAAALLALFAATRPRLIMLDGAPSLFRFELRPLLEMARRRQPRPQVGLWPRDAPVGPELAPLLAAMDQAGVGDAAARIAAP